MGALDDYEEIKIQKNIFFLMYFSDLLNLFICISTVVVVYEQNHCTKMQGKQYYCS